MLGTPATYAAKMAKLRALIAQRCKKPGVYTIDGPTTVLEAISRAGGFDIARSLGDSEEIVDLPHAFLVRNGRFVPINFTKLVREGDTSQNIYLQNNDSISCPPPPGRGRTSWVRWWNRASSISAINSPSAPRWPTWAA